MVDNLDLKVWEDGPPGRESQDKGQHRIDRGFGKIDAMPSDPFDENEDRVWNDGNADIYLLNSLVDLGPFEGK